MPILSRVHIITFALTATCIAGAGSMLAQVPLYGSKQTGKYTFTEGVTSKTTDQYEKGRVEITTKGPVTYEIIPANLSIGPNETKDWEGKMFPDMGVLPPPGKSDSASLTGKYDIHFSRPKGTDTTGTVVSTYRCGEKGCPFHNGVQGTHEIVNRKGERTYKFIVHSLNCEIPQLTYLCYNEPVAITAKGYPAGGTYKWESSSANIELVNKDSATVTVKYKGPNRGEEAIKCTYAVKDITYEATGTVNTALPANLTMTRAASVFTDDDRFQLASKIGLQYVVQCVKVWSYFFEYEYDFNNAGGIVASDPDIKSQMDNWYRGKAQQLINSGKKTQTYSEEFKWRTDEGTLLGFALGTSNYKVAGKADVTCMADGSLNVKFDVKWDVTDEIDWNSYNDVKANYNGTWHLGFLPENTADILGDKILDGEFNFSTTYEEKAYVEFKR